MIEASKQLRMLVQQHTNDQLSANIYRAKRKILLDKLDEQYNGITVSQVDITQVPTEKVHQQQDKTQPYLAKKIGKLTSFLKRNLED